VAYFAEIDENNVVLRVIAISNDEAPDPFPDSEPKGQAFIASLGLKGRWLQTSYNRNFRGRYAGIGYIYYEDRDLFSTPQPYPSWTLDDSGDWYAPVPHPPDRPDKKNIWNEDTLSWEVEDPS